MNFQSVNLPATTYSAYRGYAWSSVPAGMREETLDRLYALFADTRGEFPEPDSRAAGLVSDGRLAAAFALFSVAGWDSEGRASDYAALALFPAADAAKIDLAALLADPFFSTPTRTPPATLAYAGPAAALPGPTDAGRLLCRNRLDGFDAHAAGALLATHAPRTDRWVFLMTGGETMSVETDKWKLHLETPK